MPCPIPARPLPFRPITALALACLALPLLACSEEEARAAGPESAGARRRASVVERSRDPRAEALRAHLDLGQLDAARPLLRAIGEDPSLDLGLEGELLAARVAAAEGDDAEASRRVEAARQRDPDDPRVYATAAELHAAAGRLETARQEIERGFERCELSPELLRAQGVLFLCQQGGAGRGVELVEKALERDPELPFTRRALGQGYLLLAKDSSAAGRSREALERLVRSLEADPQDVEARRFFADLLAGDRRLAQAAEVLQELVDEGQPLEAELALMCKRAGMGELLIGRSERALDYFRRARLHGLDDEELGTGASLLARAAAGEVEAGLAAYEAGEPGVARRHFERALELDPEDLAAHNHLAVMHFLAGEFEPAALNWRWVLETAHEEGIALPEPVHLNLAKALYRAGDRTGAREVVSAYLEREPEGPWAADSREMLGELER